MMSTSDRELLFKELVIRAYDIREELNRHLNDQDYSKFYAIWRLCGEIVRLSEGKKDR